MTDDSKQALQYYYNESLQFGVASQFPTFDDFYNYILQLSPTFTSNFDTALSATTGSTSLSDADVQNAMKGLADTAQGAVPQSARDLSTFFDALLQQYQGVANWSRILSSTASDTVTAVENTAKTAAVVAAGGVAVYLIIIAGIFILSMHRGS